MCSVRAGSGVGVARRERTCVRVSGSVEVADDADVDDGECLFP